MGRRGYMIPSSCKHLAGQICQTPSCKSETNSFRFAELREWLEEHVKQLPIP